MKRITLFCTPIILLFFIIAPLPSQISNLQNFENDVKQILANVEKSVVSVNVSNTAQNGSGEKIQFTNWINGIIYKDKYILVKDHTINNKSDINIMRQNGEQYNADFVGCDDIIGLSVLHCSDLETKSIDLYEDPPEVSAGNYVIYVGNSLGVSPAVSLGTVNCIRGDGIIQITVKVPAGSYGGPIFNSNSRFIGLLSIQASNFASQESSILAFPVEETILVNPVSTIFQIADKIILKANQPWLGIGADDWPGHMGGVHIRQILPESPAAKANLQIGDIILGVNGKNWHQAKDMAEFVKTKKPGDKIKLEILRGKKKSTKILEVASMRGEPFSFRN